jgi:hypothetical protein
LSVFRRLKNVYLSYFSKPASDRLLYRAIRRHGPQKIVEIGIAQGARSLRMIQVAATRHPASEIQFTGIDPFESGEMPGLSIRDAHRLLKGSGARIRLVPGTPYEALAGVANALGKVDLIVLAPRPDVQALEDAWFYVPRLLHEQTRVYLETVGADGQVSLRLVDAAEIHSLADCRRRRAA